MNRLRTIFAIIISLVISDLGFSQNNINSPYTYYGIGEFDVFNYSRTSGIGGVAYGIKSGNFINNLNPASYAGIDSLRFMLDFSVNGSLSNFKSNNESYNAFNGNFKRIAIGFRMLKFWGVSLGFEPYTNVGYKISVFESIAGQNDYSSVQYSGEGGLSKMYLGNSFKLFKGLSVGANVSMILGYINKTKCTTYSGLFEEWYEKYRYKPTTSFSFDFGLQYSNKIKDDLNFTIGLVGGLKNEIKLVEYFSVYSSSQSNNEEKLGVESFNVPMFYGGGLSVRSKRWLFAADYQTQLWENEDVIHESGRFVNTHHVAIGSEFCPDLYLGRTLFKRMTYQLGLHYDRTSLTVLSNNYDIYGLSFGVIIPFKMQLSSLSLSIDLGTKGKKTNSLFRENYIKFNIGVNFSDFWFVKRQYE